MQFVDGQHIHCIGVGGFGISAIARILLERGFSVSGSDRNRNALTDALAADGATIYHGHAAPHVSNADIIIASSAIPEDHVEILAAHAQDIPVYKRRDILGALLVDKKVIAVAGTHGKTTTTSLIVHILRENGYDPSYIVGGVMANTGSNAGVGDGEYFVIEADEYDNMFLGINPDIAVVTNIEYDHPDFFVSWVQMRDAFYAFVDRLPEDGVLIGCGDDAATEMLLNQQKKKAYKQLLDDKPARTIIAYGVDFLDFVDVLGWHQRIDEDDFNAFDVEIEGKLFGSLGSVRSPIPGKHNMQNALAALTVANVLRISVPEAAKAIESFRSTGRRFEIRGEVNDVTVIDDYAHHPTAITRTLEAAKLRYPDRSIWAVWQPHMYSRTQKLLDDYATAFTLADHVIVTPIYAAREAPIPGVDAQTVAAAIEHQSVRHITDFTLIAQLMQSEITSSAVIIIMSAGDAPAIGELYLSVVRSEQSDTSA